MRDFEDTSIKELINGFTEEQKKIALKYFPIDFIQEEIKRREDIVRSKVEKIKKEVDRLDDEIGIMSANLIFDDLIKILEG